MPRAVQSFDVFDTLIARRSGDPARVLERLEARAGIPGLATARRAADRHLGSLGRPYQLREMWQEVQRTMGLNQAAAARLMALELELEHDEVIPIAENLARVRDGDVLVSDTYLPADVVWSLLQRAGLDRQVGLVVSNDGKFRGRVWPELLARTAVERHIGDNPYSDGHTPTVAGIKAAIYSGADRSPVERGLTECGWEPLANLVREVRLANPLPESRPQERHLWWLACQLNFPLLVLASLQLERYCLAGGVREVFFVSRDCLMWHGLFRALYPHRRATYLYASRQCLLKPTESYLEYFRGTWHGDGVVVDLSSTGASWSALFARLNARSRCWFIGHIDNYGYLPGAIAPAEWLDMTAVFQDSELGQAVNKGVEMLNYAPHPRVEDVILLPGGAARPVLAETLEYDPALPTAAHRSFRMCVGTLSHYPELSRPREDDPNHLIRQFVRHICADRQLPVIYAGHQAADLAYVQRILGG